MRYAIIAAAAALVALAAAPAAAVDIPRPSFAAPRYDLPPLPRGSRYQDHLPEGQGPEDFRRRPRAEERPFPGYRPPPRDSDGTPLNLPLRAPSPCAPAPSA